jgi:cephalosporin-C deacetylase-like acetyl esterase
MEKKLQDYKDKRNLEKGFNAYWNKGFNEAIDFIKEQQALQLLQANVVRSKRLKEEQLEREQKCGDHYYLPRGKWQSGMVCQDCGKTID